MDTIALLVLAIIFLLIELATVSLTTLWFSLGALSACIVSLWTDNQWILTIIFFVVSIVTLCVFRSPVMKHFNKNRIKTNSDSLIGMSAMVTEKIDNRNMTGTAVLNGQEWTSRACEDDMIIPKGTMVRVVKIAGVKLIVTDKPEYDNNIKEN